MEPKARQLLFHYSGTGTTSVCKQHDAVPYAGSVKYFWQAKVIFIKRRATFLVQNNSKFQIHNS